MYRVYFNRSSDFPFVWSFDDGDIANEVIVKAIHGCKFDSDYDPSGDNVNTPRGFFWVKADMAVLSDGEVWFYE